MEERPTTPAETAASTAAERKVSVDATKASAVVTGRRGSTSPLPSNKRKTTPAVADEDVEDVGGDDDGEVEEVLSVGDGNNLSASSPALAADGKISRKGKGKGKRKSSAAAALKGTSRASSTRTSGSVFSPAFDPASIGPIPSASEAERVSGNGPAVDEMDVKRDGDGAAKNIRRRSAQGGDVAVDDDIGGPGIVDGGGASCAKKEAEYVAGDGASIRVKRKWNDGEGEEEDDVGGEPATAGSSGVTADAKRRAGDDESRREEGGDSHVKANAAAATTDASSGAGAAEAERVMPVKGKGKVSPSGYRSADGATAVAGSRRIGDGVDRSGSGADPAALPNENSAGANPVREDGGGDDHEDAVEEEEEEEEDDDDHEEGQDSDDLHDQIVDFVNAKCGAPGTGSGGDNDAEETFWGDLIAASAASSSSRGSRAHDAALADALAGVGATTEGDATNRSPPAV